MSEVADLEAQLAALREEIARVEEERVEDEERHQEKLHALRGEANKIALRLQLVRMRNELV